MNLARLVLGAVLPTSLAVFCCACGAPQEQVDAILALTGDSAAGGVIFEANCTECHGDDAKSGTVNSDITDTSEEGIAAVLLTGNGPAMPAFGEQLSDQEIADVVAFVTSL